jgi:RNA polymerase sigma-70 factor (ECF subfamily)
MIYCVVPRELAPKLHELLRREFREDGGVEVVVERRGGDRRASADRRGEPAAAPGGSKAAAARREAADRRRVRNRAGRRLSDRRASLLTVDPPRELPRKARAHAAEIRFFERIEPTDQAEEDLDTARLVLRLQAGEGDLFSILYLRYFERVYAYLRVVLRSQEEAEDAAQQVFLKVFEALPRYEVRKAPFRGWLFTIVRNQSVDALQLRNRVEATDPAELERQLDTEVAPGSDLTVLDWVTDRELLLFIERLPLVQRQVLMLRYMHDLAYAEIAAILDRSPDDVRKQQQRGVAFLRARLEAIGRAPKAGRPAQWRRKPTYLRVIRARRYVLR